MKLQFKMRVRDAKNTLEQAKTLTRYRLRKWLMKPNHR